MSQKPSPPKSPGSPRSKSPSCPKVDGTEVEGNQPPGSILDELQRRMEEELRNTDRILGAFINVIAKNTETPQDEYGSLHHSVSRPPTAPGSYRSSQRAACTYTEQKEENRTLSPHRSATPHSSRNASLRESQNIYGTNKNPSAVNYMASRGTSEAQKSQVSPSVNCVTSKNTQCFEECGSMMPCGTSKEQSVLGLATPSRLPDFPRCKFSEDIEKAPAADGLEIRASTRDCSQYTGRFRANGSQQPCGAYQPTCSHVGGRRTSPPNFAATPFKEITEEHRPHRENRSPSPPFGRNQIFNSRANAKSLKAERDPHSHHHYEGPDESLERDEKKLAALAHLSQLRKTPSYFRCGINQGIDFLKTCCPKVKDGTRAGGRIIKLPEKPCLNQEDIDELIRCETQDVTSAWCLFSDENKTYKKPCPKQQKVQMTVKALVQAHTSQICGTQKYSPLEHPDPEDISPEVAAAMMFSQEQGIKLERCPDDTIAHLFPDVPRKPFPEKSSKGNVSVVNPNQNEIIEKSALVPSEGVSDSAYTRTMKEKGEEVGPQRSYDVDFAIGQSKREYVLVAQEPQRVNRVQFRGGNSPPWFPGYLSAFPDDEGDLKVVSSPSGLFHKAWVHSNPGNMPPGDVIVLD